jgi:hypothetical protein
VSGAAGQGLHFRRLSDVRARNMDMAAYASMNGHELHVQARELCSKGELRAGKLCVCIGYTYLNPKP